MDTVVVGPRGGETKILKDDGSGFTKEFFRQKSSGRPIEQVVIEQNASLRSGEQELAEVQRAIYMEKKRRRIARENTERVRASYITLQEEKIARGRDEEELQTAEKKIEAVGIDGGQMEQMLAETNSRIDAIQKRLKGVDKGAVKEQEKALETVLANAEKRIRS